MRNPDRLFEIYKMMYDFHFHSFPDLRVMQLLNSFFIWYQQKYGNDGFYLEDGEFIARFKEFAKNLKGVK